MRKGPAAAALTSLARYTLRAAACHCPDHPSAVLAELNNTLLADPAADSRFCTTHSRSSVFHTASIDPVRVT